MEGRLKKYLIYATGEILLVMIGILLALQVNNWNENRKLKIREANFLKEIHAEFVTNKAQFERINSIQREVIDYCDKLIALFPIDLETVDLDSLQAYIIGTFDSGTFNPSQGTINSLIYSSSFDLISDEKLRKLLIKWSDVLADYQEEEIATINFMNSHHTSYFSKNFNWDVNLRDPRMDKSILESFEFENMIQGLKSYLIDILTGSDLEYETVVEYMDEIIERTKDYQ